MTCESSTARNSESMGRMRHLRMELIVSVSVCVLLAGAFVGVMIRTVSNLNADISLAALEGFYDVSDIHTTGSIPMRDIDAEGPHRNIPITFKSKSGATLRGYVRNGRKIYVGVGPDSYAEYDGDSTRYGDSYDWSKPGAAPDGNTNAIMAKKLKSKGLVARVQSTDSKDARGADTPAAIPLPNK